MLLGALSIPDLMAVGRKYRPTRAAENAKLAVAQALTYAKDTGTYPTSLKNLREQGYANIPDWDPWGDPHVLAPVLVHGRPPHEGEDVYVYSRGLCGTGTYEPSRWRKRSDGSWDTGKCGAVGYSSLHGAFIADTAEEAEPHAMDSLGMRVGRN